MTADLAPKPLFLTFAELTLVTWPLHMGEKHWLDLLHDVWLTGAPAPRAIIRDPRNRNAVVVTNNGKDFEMLGAGVENWASP